jgi:hypothetical protein
MDPLERHVNCFKPRKKNKTIGELPLKCTRNRKDLAGEWAEYTEGTIADF